MENDYQQPVVVSDANPRKNLYESIMFIFGGLAILSLVVNNGFFLKISAGIFLIVATVAVIRALATPKPPAQPLVQSQPGVTFGPVTVKRKRSALKILGIVILVIALTPVIGYLAFMGLILIMFSMGGGAS